MKIENGRLLIITVLALFLCLTGLPALAQDKPADTMPLVREKVKVDKKLFVAETMNLTKSEAKSFWPIYENYQKDLTKIYDRTMSMLREYANNHQSMSSELARKLTDDFMAIEADFHNLKESYLPLFRGALGEIKTARYYQLENKISAAINYDAANNIPLVGSNK